MLVLLVCDSSLCRMMWMNPDTGHVAVLTEVALRKQKIWSVSDLETHMKVVPTHTHPLACCVNCFVFPCYSDSSGASNQCPVWIYPSTPICPFYTIFQVSCVISVSWSLSVFCGFSLSHDVESRALWGPDQLWQDLFFLSLKTSLDVSACLGSLSFCRMNLGLSRCFPDGVAIKSSPKTMAL